MTGIGIRLPVTFNNSLLRKRRDDIILSDGSLVLVDFAHSSNPLMGAPVTGTKNIPNIAWKEAAAMHGSGTQNAWSLDTVANVSSSDGFIERSGKGGVHVCMSQSTHSGTGKGFETRRQVDSASPLLQYLYANMGNDFYFSQWEKITRVGITTNPENSSAAAYASTGSSSASNCLFNLSRAVTYNATLGSANSPSLPQPLGDSFRCGGFGGWTAAGRPSSAATIIASFLAIGQLPVVFGAGPVNSSRSAILYRAYLEDLTVSGRTYAEVKAIDQALFSQAFAVGGRFYNDTFTTLIP